MKLMQIIGCKESKKRGDYVPSRKAHKKKETENKIKARPA
jgi:hypothetical protein